MPRLVGSLATAEKTRTVAEGYRTRRFIWSIWLIWFVLFICPNLRVLVGMALAGLAQFREEEQRQWEVTTYHFIIARWM